LIGGSRRPAVGLTKFLVAKKAPPESIRPAIRVHRADWIDTSWGASHCGKNNIDPRQVTLPLPMRNRTLSFAHSGDNVLPAAHLFVRQKPHA